MGEYTKTYQKIEELEQEIEVQQLVYSQSKAILHAAECELKIAEHKGLGASIINNLAQDVKLKTASFEKEYNRLDSLKEIKADCEAYILELKSIDGGE